MKEENRTGMDQRIVGGKAISENRGEADQSTGGGQIRMRAGKEGVRGLQKGRVMSGEQNRRVGGEGREEGKT